MPSRSTSRIRRLMPHRRTLSGIDSTTPYDSDEGPEYEEMDGRKDSWYIRRQKQPSKPARARATSVQVGQDAFCPSITPRSSDSSLCSCGHNEDFASQPNTLRRPCLCTLSSKDDRRSDGSLQGPDNATHEDEDPSFERSSNGRHTDSPGLARSSEESIASTLSSGSRDNPPHRAKGIPRRSSETIWSQLPPEEFSDDILKLIREADEAFEAVGISLAEARRLRRYSSDEDLLPSPQAATFEEEPPLMSGSILDRPGPPTPDISPILRSQSPLRLTPPINSTSFNVSPALPAPTRNTSVTKRKKKHPKAPKIKAPPKTVKARKPIPNRSAAAKHAPRWTLTENVTELFTGRLFNKVEVDEMLTEAQLEEYKRRRMSNLKTQQQEASETPKPSFESLEATPSSSSEAKPASETKASDTEESSIDTPIEPFHLEDLPSRIGSAGVKLTAETPVEEKNKDKKEAVVGPTFFYDDDDPPEPQEFSVDKDELFLDEPSSSNNTSTSWNSATTAVAARGSSHSSPPTKKSLKGLMAGRKQPPGLPSIPEANSAPRTPMVMDELFLDLQQKQQKLQLQDSVADSDYVYLRASPYTLTVPGFRHGPIRVAKADLIPEPTLGGSGADDGLDWTAFQMAILGGAGDWNSESDDTIHRRTVEELDDLVDWWESWNFQGNHGNGLGLGSLVTSEEAEQRLQQQQQAPPSPASTLSGTGIGEYSYSYSDNASASVYSDIKQDNPYSAHDRWQTLRRQAAVQGLGLPGPKTSALDNGTGRASSNNTNNNSSSSSSSNFNRDYHERHSSKIFMPAAAPALNPSDTAASMNPTSTTTSTTTTAVPTSTFSTTSGGGAGMKPKPRPLELDLAGKSADGGGGGVGGDKLPPKFAADRHSLASLPQSPMLDLRVISDPEGDDVDVEVVPMGYNLGHDLGDFLKWEAEHVYAYSDVMM